ncbi:MBL fold metallo-hydrolase [Paeniglutamicibacter cryotolerans]|uniref:Ribonuclease BN (tRNA processing enzyme) n=1 Tax=Paeniglutamicibacter cryotolerans TaxID=670079 RepID=A0A839QLB3_9MICC|nr:MBL fold metallo-hydrolase [Paeniglutamicibacter cryotolerans]MBB2995554.1 ribonuclease BN (tRNA processing enzyme) [Paeniglutamicibacter cryotolerans]
MQSTSLKPHVVTLGTAGGPRWWTGENAGKRSGIATAVVVGSAVYLVDAGTGVGNQLMKAGFTVADLRGIFLTHLHSDHTIDLASLAIFGMFNLSPGQAPIHIVGPGNRGALPPASPRAAVAPQPLYPANPTPGTADMFSHLMQAYATDLNDRVIDALRPSPLEHFIATDIVIPEGTGYHPNQNPTPEDFIPFEIYSDDLVTVTATLVKHPPIAPAFAFRFDTAEGSVTISGDTAPCENLVTLAAGTDLLLHEAIDFDWVERSYGSIGTEAARASMDHHRVSHTSPAQAIELAERAGVRTLALHHLVPGTTPLSVWLSHADGFSGTFLVPDDLETISFAHVPSEMAATR